MLPLYEFETKVMDNYAPIVARYTSVRLLWRIDCMRPRRLMAFSINSFTYLFMRLANILVKSSYYSLLYSADNCQILTSIAYYALGFRGV